MLYHDRSSQACDQRTAYTSVYIAHISHGHNLILRLDYSSKWLGVNKAGDTEHMRSSGSITRDAGSTRSADLGTKQSCTWHTRHIIGWTLYTNRRCRGAPIKAISPKENRVQCQCMHSCCTKRNLHTLTTIQSTISNWLRSKASLYAALHYIAGAPCQATQQLLISGKRGCVSRQVAAHPTPSGAPHRPECRPPHWVEFAA